MRNPFETSEFKMPGDMENAWFCCTIKKVYKKGEKSEWWNYIDISLTIA